METKNENIYYIYAYLDQRKPGTWFWNDYVFCYEPFYVGKGRDTRLNVHFKQASGIHKKKGSNPKVLKRIQEIKKDIKEKPIIGKVYYNLSENDAYEMEKDCIKQIGRKCIGRGPLLNVSPGGKMGYCFNDHPNKERIREIHRQHGKERYLKHPEHYEKMRKKVLGKNNRWYGIDRSREKSNKWMNIDMNKAVELRKQGLSIKAIAKIVRLSHPSLKKRFDYMGFDYKSYAGKDCLGRHLNFGKSVLAKDRDKNWTDNFNKWKEYNKNRKASDSKNPSYNWEVLQREYFHKNKLNQWQIDLLTKENFIFDNRKYNFDKMFKKLLEFKEKFHHLRVPSTYRNSLSSWVVQLGYRHKDETLNNYELEKLKNINFPFEFKWAKLNI